MPPILPSMFRPLYDDTDNVPLYDGDSKRPLYEAWVRAKHSLYPANYAVATGNYYASDASGSISSVYATGWAAATAAMLAAAVDTVGDPNSVFYNRWWIYQPSGKNTQVLVDIRAVAIPIRIRQYQTTLALVAAVLQEIRFLAHKLGSRGGTDTSVGPFYNGNTASLYWGVTDGTLTTGQDIVNACVNEIPAASIHATNGVGLLLPLAQFPASLLEVDEDVDIADAGKLGHECHLCLFYDLTMPSFVSGQQFNSEVYREDTVRVQYFAITP